MYCAAFQIWTIEWPVAATALAEPRPDRGSTDLAEFDDDRGMTRIVLFCLAALAAATAAAPARADFGACVTALRADAVRAGVSHATLDRAFDGLQPDMKVLEFQKAQPEFKTPIWDYMDGLVDEERVADGKAAMAREARALAHAEETFGVSRYMLAAIWGVEFELRFGNGRAPPGRSRSRLSPATASAPAISVRS